jgi:hypothetical protein
LLKQADQLYSNIIYENQYIMLSDKVLANKKNILQMVYLEDVYLIYEHMQSMNFVRYMHELVLENKNKKNTIRINVYAKGKKIEDELFHILSQACPQAKLGWTHESQLYLEEMRKIHGS